MRAKAPQDELYRLAIGEGFAEIGPDSVRLLVSVGEPEEEVDRDRADSVAGRARDRLRRRSDNSIDVDLTPSSVPARMLVIRTNEPRPRGWQRPAERRGTGLWSEDRLRRRRPVAQ